MAALCLAGTPCLAAEILPEVSVHLRAARYAPTQTDFHWQGWIGAGAGVFRVKGATTYFTADVETIIGDTLRAFDANQAAYHLETGIRGRVGPGTATVFFHHVSRHAIDREKTQAVDWNLLGARYAWDMSAGDHPVRAMASIAHTTLASFVGYRWEVIGHVDAEPLRIGGASLFARGDVRLVTVEDSDLPRGSFVDASVETGPRWTRDGRALDLFAAYEHRNDIRVEVAGAVDRALFGFRISYLR